MWRSRMARFSARLEGMTVPACAHTGGCAERHVAMVCPDIPHRIAGRQQLLDELQLATSRRPET